MSLRRVVLAATPLMVAVVLVASLMETRTAAGKEGPPPTPVPPNGSPSPFPQHLETTENDRVPPKLRAKAVVLADLDSGQVLFAVRPTVRRPIASVTKIMTGLLVLEEAGPGERVKVSQGATRTSGIPGLSTLPLKAGERRTVEELLDALLIQSANDVAVALAEHVGGSVTDFVKMMNRRAKGLGMRDTRFASPNGLNDAGYSSASDLVTLTRVAMDLPEFREVVETKFATIPGPTASSRPRKIQNRNILLWLYPGATGVKTGFTSRAGYCIVATAERNGRHLVAVVLGEPTAAYDDAAELLNYGFGGFREKLVAQAGEVVAARTIGGTKVSLALDEALSGLVPRDARGEPKVTVSVADDASPTEGSLAGEAFAQIGRTRLGPVPVVVASVEAPGDPVGGDPVAGATLLDPVPPSIRGQVLLAARVALDDLLGIAA